MTNLRKILINTGLVLLAAVVLFLWIALPLLFAVLTGLFLIWLAVTRAGRQSIAVTISGLSTIPQRLGATSVVIVGIAGVVGVLVSLLAMGGGFEATLQQSGNDQTAIVLRKGSDSELSSGVDRQTATLVSNLASVLRDADGDPIASPEVVVIANMPKKATGTDANVAVRGVGSQVWKLRPHARIVEGRAFEPGLRELVVGAGAHNQFEGLELGSSVRLNDQSWTVVGIFDSGDAHNSEVWGDNESVAAAYRRGGFQSMTVHLTSPEAMSIVEAEIAADPRLQIDVQTTRDYYTKQSRQLTTLIRILGTGIAVIMAIGAVFGALNTMYAAVADRAREIATLRALGFRAGPVVVSILVESMLLAALGGLLGALIAFVVFNGYTVSTLGSNFSQVVFQFDVDAALLVKGIQWALAIGFLGGLFPALRAATLPIVVAMRED